MNGSPDDHQDWMSFGLADLLDRPIAFHRSFVTLTGSVNAALILSQAIYWQRRVPEKNNGWWYKSQIEWQAETGLSRREQETARKQLRQGGILLEQRRDMPSKLWFRVNQENLTEPLDKPIAFHRRFVDLAGSVSAALMLSQAIYWQKRVPQGRDGWWYKSQSDWTEETGLSRREQETARKRLQNAGIVSEERRGMPSKLWYRVNEAVLKRQLSVQIEFSEPRKSSDDQRLDNQACDDELKTFTRLAEYAILKCTNPPFKAEVIENSRLAFSANLDCTLPPIKNDRSSSMAQSAGQEWRIAPINYKETETTSETTPPPQTPPQSARDRGGGGEKVNLISTAVVETDSEDGTRCRGDGRTNDLELVFPAALSKPERQAAQTMVAQCGQGAQEILDVLAVIIRAGEVRKSPLAVLRGLVKRWGAGSFDASTGLHLAAARGQAAKIRKQVLAQKTVRPTVKKRNGPPPETIEAFRRLRRKGRHL